MTQKKDPLVSEPEIAEEQIDGTSDDAKMTLSLMGGVGKPDSMPEPADLDLESMKVGGRLVSQGTLVIFLVLAVAVGVLFVMRRAGNDMGTGLSPDVMVKVEEAISRHDQPNDPLKGPNRQELFAGTQAMIDLLKGAPIRKQVPIEEVKQNPFTLAISKPTVENPTAPPTSADNRARHRTLELAAKAMKLQSVMTSSKMPVAVIDGSLYQVGQEVGAFTIAAIKERQVDLVAGDYKYTLTMVEEPGARPRGR